MRIALHLLLPTLALVTVAYGQPGRPPQTPVLLKDPAGWRFEKMPVPPGFAPDIPISGFEEIRFAPGMFDNTSPTYLTYVMVIAADGAPDLGAPEIKDYLQKYYRGLSTGVGRPKRFTPDPAQMNAEVTAEGSAPEKHGGRFRGDVVFYDTFTDGRKVTLHVEARVVPASGKTYLILLVSPQPKDDAVWRKLREIDQKLSFAAPL